jgi:catechol 2,3-dioxygenase-like lactoylglutathione lyase family enzyme
MSLKRKLGLIVAAAANILAVGEAGAQQTPAAAQVPRMGSKAEEFLMTKVTVGDVMRSYEFYTSIVGLKHVSAPAIGLNAAPPTNADNSKAMVEVALNFGGTLRDPLFILLKQRDVTPVPAQAGLVWLAFRVPDTEAVVRRAEAAGFKQFRPSLAGGRVAFIHDPDGYAVEIIQISPFDN